jgi:hypothetical protein
MKKVIRLMESDLTRIVKRVIREMDYDDDDFKTTFNKNDYDELLGQAREFLVDNAEDIGFEVDDFYNMSDNKIIKNIRFYDKELYNRLKDIQDIKMSDPDEPYDSIGGFSVNDLQKAFKKTR